MHKTHTVEWYVVRSYQLIYMNVVFIAVAVTKQLTCAKSNVQDMKSGFGIVKLCGDYTSVFTVFQMM